MMAEPSRARRQVSERVHLEVVEQVLAETIHKAVLARDVTKRKTHLHPRAYVSRAGLVTEFEKRRRTGYFQTQGNDFKNGE